MELTVKPLDTLFFRDGKPFARGEETWADSTFPPSPSVIYGALRTALATVQRNEIPFSEVPLKLNAKVFSIGNIFYRVYANKYYKNYFVLPLDFVEYKNRDTEPIKKGGFHKVHLLELTKSSSILSETKSFIKYFLHPHGYQIAENLTTGLLNANELMNYLNGNIYETKALNLNDFVVAEPKVGIGRDNTTRTAEEGLLYRVDMKRLSGIEISVKVNTNHDSREINNTIVNLGGEKKLVIIEVAEESVIDKFDIPNLNEGKFKIYLSTPAFFVKKGWQPDLERFGIRANLIAASIGKTLNIGGFDLLKNIPKPMLKAVPAGSVYYYETDEDSSKIIKELHNKALSDYLPEQGYGIAFVGNINNMKS